MSRINIVDLIDKYEEIQSELKYIAESTQSYAENTENGLYELILSTYSKTMDESLERLTEALRGVREENREYSVDPKEVLERMFNKEEQRDTILLHPESYKDLLEDELLTKNNRPVRKTTRLREEDIINEEVVHKIKNGELRDIKHLMDVDLSYKGPKEGLEIKSEEPEKYIIPDELECWKVVGKEEYDRYKQEQEEIKRHKRNVAQIAASNSRKD